MAESAMTEAGPRPLFSVVVAVRNGVRTLQACLDSVFAQRGIAVEVVVIDGGSIDGTVAILEANAARIASWISEPDRGICDAWNKALRRTRGEWLVFLGADDRFASETLLAEVAPLLPGPEREARIAYGRVDVVNSDGEVMQSAGTPWADARIEFLRHNTIPHQGVFHHRTLFDLNGPFDQRFRILGDYEFLLRELKDHDPVYLDVTVTRMGAGGLSARPDSAWLATREAHRARYVNGLARVPEWLSFRIARATAYEVIRRVLGPSAARAAANAYLRVTGREPRTPSQR